MSLTPADLFGLTKTHLAATQDGFLLHQDVLSDLLTMQKAAANEGIELALASSFRDFERQVLIWNNKFSGQRAVFDRVGDQVQMSELDEWQKVKAILTYSALPGTSRHHWGTDIDVYDNAAIDETYKLQLEPKEYGSQGQFYKLSNWLAEHSNKYGFFRPYLYDQGGVAAELWHLSHQVTADKYSVFFKQNAYALLNLLSEHQVGGVASIEQNFDYILERYVYNIVT